MAVSQLGMARRRALMIVLHDHVLGSARKHRGRAVCDVSAPRPIPRTFGIGLVRGRFAQVWRYVVSVKVFGINRK